VRWAIATLIAMTLFATVEAPAQDRDEAEASGPIDVGQVEQVEVQLVLLDVLALDRRDRTVPGLTVDEFELQVDSKKIEIASLDVDCPLGMAKDPRAMQPVEVPDLPPGAAPRRIVHAFDYYHMGDFVAWTIETAQEAIRRLSTGTEEHMIVTIGSGLRIQSPFTSDLDRIDATLERMFEDPRLYAGFYGRLTERPFYRRLASLIDFLELIEGAKIVVLYSGPFLPDGFNHDPEFKQISAMAAKARVALYPVDSAGMRTPRGFRYGDLGGPKALARLAVETGGRVTYHTNDLGLALARAQRDYGCRYTLGFYDSEPKLDQVRRVSIAVARGGVRAVYPVHYVLRSDGKKLDSQARTAGMVPEMYEDGGMTAVAVPFRPATPGRWEVLLAVGLPDRVGGPETPEPYTLEGRVITPSGAVVRSFERDSLPADSPLSIFETVTLKPGGYRASVVLSREGISVPWATHADLDLATLPTDRLFVVGPHLGEHAPYLPRDAEASSAVTGPLWRFEPLLDGQVSPGGTIEALTWVCLVREELGTSHATVRHELVDATGTTIRSFDPVHIELDDSAKLRCGALSDVVSTSSLEVGRYGVRAFLEGDESGSEAAFVVSN
jgi:VWFA-related protein